MRAGEFGRLFTIYKFRSMRTDAEKGGAQFAQENDPRVTRVGKFIRKSRLDELPQLWNVLRGDMSMVGPRPERPIFIEQLEQQVPFFKQRLYVKPGVTGHAQVRCRYGASTEDMVEKLQYDLYYIKSYNTVLRPPRSCSIPSRSSCCASALARSREGRAGGRGEGEGGGDCGALARRPPPYSGGRRCNIRGEGRPHCAQTGRLARVGATRAAPSESHATPPSPEIFGGGTG